MTSSSPSPTSPPNPGDNDSLSNQGHHKLRSDNVGLNVKGHDKLNTGSQTSMATVDGHDANRTHLRNFTATWDEAPTVKKGRRRHSPFPLAEHVANLNTTSAARRPGT